MGHLYWFIHIVLSQNPFEVGVVSTVSKKVPYRLVRGMGLILLGFITNSKYSSKNTYPSERENAFFMSMLEAKRTLSSTSVVSSCSLRAMSSFAWRSTGSAAV